MDRVSHSSSPCVELQPPRRRSRPSKITLLSIVYLQIMLVFGFFFLGPMQPRTRPWPCLCSSVSGFLPFGNYSFLFLYSTPAAKEDSFLVGSEDQLISTQLVYEYLICLTCGFTFLTEVFFWWSPNCTYLPTGQSWHQQSLQSRKKRLKSLQNSCLYVKLEFCYK